VRARGRLAATLVAALALAVPAVAAAEAVTAAELAVLVERAATDEAARERLLAVDRVDGEPVAVRDALSGARGDDFARRARLLAASVRPAEGSPAEDRRRAQAVLAERRFKGAGVPRPFAGAMEWLGDRLQPIADWLDDLGGNVPGGPLVLWTALAALVIVAAAAITSTTIRRRAVAIERARAAALPATEDPHALEREAGRAERDGDWERAVRLRFRAGLLRLDRRRVIEYRPSLTTGEVARAVASPAFDEVGERFDAIAYGGRPAEREDAEHARRGWAEVLAR
jgi:hypothetical protein